MYQFSVDVFAKAELKRCFLKTFQISSKTVEHFDSFNFVNYFVLMSLGDLNFKVNSL